MLRFQGQPKGRKPARNYFSRREQFRLLTMVFALGFAVLAATWALNPANWAWFFAAGTAPEGGSPAGPVAVAPTQHEPRQTTVPLPPLPADTVRVVSSQNAEAGDGSDYYPGVVPAYLREVMDNRPFRSQEAPAWFNLLAILNKADAQSLARASAGNISYLQLDQQPEAYRGRLVNFQGRIRRIHKEEVGQNAEGITHCYAMILKPQDGPPRPIVVYALQLPPGLQPSESLDEPVQLTGFFFKNWLYPGEHSTYVAPVLLARDVTWTPPPAVEPPFRPDRWSLAGLLAGSALAAAIVAYWAYRSARRSLKQPVNPEDVRASLAIMAQHDTPTDEHGFRG